jgi:hypothetical protein
MSCCPTGGPELTLMKVVLGGGIAQEQLFLYSSNHRQKPTECRLVH